MEFKKHPLLTGIIVMRERTQQPNWVAAVFQNAAVRLEVARQTTLAQLAEQLSSLAEVHGKLMLPVHVRVATAPSLPSPVTGTPAILLDDATSTWRPPDGPGWGRKFEGRK